MIAECIDLHIFNGEQNELSGKIEMKTLFPQKSLIQDEILIKIPPKKLQV